MGFPIYCSYCSIDLLSVKASVVLDSAFCDLKNVLFRNIFIYGKKSFYKSLIESIEKILTVVYL